MPALAISVERDTVGTQTKFRNKKSISYKFISDITGSNFTMTSH